MRTTRDPVRLTLRAALVLAVAALVLACGAGLERTARNELLERGFQNVALQRIERTGDAFSFTGDRSGVPCRGEIELREQMGQTLATVSDRCGAE